MKSAIFAAALALSSPVVADEAQKAPAKEAPTLTVTGPAKPTQTMKFSQQHTIVMPTEIRVGPGIACRMDATALVCTVARPAPSAAK